MLRNWRAHRPKPDDDVLVVLRLNASNIAIQDYVLVRVSDCPKYLTLSDSSLARHRAARVETVDKLIAEIKARFVWSSHAAPPTPTLRNQRRKPRPPKTKCGRARR